MSEEWDSRKAGKTYLMDIGGGKSGGRLSLLTKFTFKEIGSVRLGGWMTGSIW